MIHECNMTNNAVMYVPFQEEDEYVSHLGLSCYHAISSDYNAIHENMYKTIANPESKLKWYILAIIVVSLLILIMLIAIIIMIVHRKRIGSYDMPPIDLLELNL